MKLVDEGTKRAFRTKGYGRIYVAKEEDVQRVKDIIKEMDPFEFEYLPDNLIALFSEYPVVVFVHKFDDLDLDALTATCWDRGIFVWVFSTGDEKHPNNLIKGEYL